MKKIVLILILGMFLVSFITAQLTSLGTFEVSTDVNLVQICGTCTNNNITSITSPNSSVIVSNVEMTKDGSNYNYTLVNNFTGTTGTYIVNGVGDLGGIDTAWNYDFTITQTGEALDEAQGLIVLGLIILLIFITGAFLYFGNKIEYVPFKIFLISLGVLFLMLTIGIALNAIKELMLIGSVFSGTFVSLYRLILILVSAGGIGLIVYLVYVGVHQFYQHRGLIDSKYDID